MSFSEILVRCNHESFSKSGGGGNRDHDPRILTNGHGQNDHFDHAHKTVFFIKWSKLTDISTTSTNFNNFNYKKIWNCRYGHDRIWIDQFDHRTSIWPRGQFSWSLDPPPPITYRLGHLSSFIVRQG
jgi:hypothetical protein